MRKTLVSLSLVGALLGLGATAVKAGQPGPSKPAWSHVVAPGETLWDLAEAAVPGTDPRETVDRLIKDNDLAGATILPGQRLVLRSS